MSRLIVGLLLAAAAHFSLTYLIPASAGAAWFGWPFARDSAPFLGALQTGAGRTAATLLADVAGLSFIAAALGLFGIWVPPEWWRPLVLVGSIASGLLFLMYAGPLALLPLVVDAVLLWGVLAQGWNVASLAR